MTSRTFCIIGIQNGIGSLPSRVYPERTKRCGGSGLTVLVPWHGMALTSTLQRAGYRIAETFEGENLHEFRDFSAIRESFLHEILGMPHPLCEQF